jgi:hypothetical protein
MTQCADVDPPMTGAAVAASQREWLRIHRELVSRRGELTPLVARDYPDLTIVGPTDLLVPPRWLPAAPIPLEALRLDRQPDAAYDGLTGHEDVSAHLRPFRSTGAARYACYADAVGELAAPAVFQNRGLFRLLAADLAGDRRLSFGRGRYFDTINVGHAVGHEYAQQGDGPLRAAIGDPTDPRRRVVGTAISTLTLRLDRGTGDASFVLHWRDPAKVAHAGGLFQVMPVGVFQPSGEALWNETNDFDLWRNMVREFNEELLGASENYNSDDAPIDYAAMPLFAHMTAGRQAGTIRPYVLGMGVDPLTMATDLLTVVVFDAPVFDELFAGLVDSNEEGRVVAHLGDDARGIAFTGTNIDRFVRDEPMQAAGAAILWLAWQHRDLLLAD